MTGVQDTVETTTLGLRNVRSNTERLLIAAHSLKDNEDRETPNEYKIRKKNERKTVDKKKQLGHAKLISCVALPANLQKN